MKLDIATDRPSDGCPISTYGCDDHICPNTCFCEDHCSWHKCKLKTPPLSCIAQENRKWDYDSRTKSWKIILEGIFVMGRNFGDILLNIPKHLYQITLIFFL